VQRVGANAEEYWRTLKCFLEMGLTKAELDQQVPLLIGLHNVHHHNEFIRAIVTNACNAELPALAPVLLSASIPCSDKPPRLVNVPEDGTESRHLLIHFGSACPSSLTAAEAATPESSAT
jgi:hypothetical protein